MESSKLGYRVWVIAIYLHCTNVKGISSLRLSRELRVTQRTAWFLLQRLRDACAPELMRFEGPVEADETHLGGR